MFSSLGPPSSRNGRLSSQPSLISWGYMISYKWNCPRNYEHDRIWDLWIMDEHPNHCGIRCFDPSSSLENQESRERPETTESAVNVIPSLSSLWSFSKICRFPKMDKIFQYDLFFGNACMETSVYGGFLGHRVHIGYTQSSSNWVGIFPSINHPATLGYPHD